MWLYEGEFMTNFRNKLAAMAVAAIAMAAPVSAATLTVGTQGKNAFLDAAGQNAWHQRTSYKLNGTSRTAAAGMFRLTATDIDGTTKNFLAFCLEPLATLTLPKDHTVGINLGSSVLDRLGALMSNAFGKVTNSQTAAAFQIAAWELSNESSGTLSLANGNFVLTSAQTSTRTLAQSWLNQIASGNWKSGGKVTYLSAPGTQDLITDIPAPVPLPAAGAMLIGGLAGLGALRRRRKKA